MKFAAGLFVLLSILSLPAGAQAMFAGDADAGTRQTPPTLRAATYLQVSP